MPSINMKDKFIILSGMGFVRLGSVFGGNGGALVKLGLNALQNPALKHCELLGI